MEKHCDAEKGCDAKRACNCDTKKECGAEKAKKGDLIRYYLKGVNTPLLYNDVQVVPPLEPIITKTEKKIEKGPRASTFRVTGIEEWYVLTLLHIISLQRPSRPNAR